MADTATLAPAEPARQAAPPVVHNRFVNASAEHIEPFYDSGAVAPGTDLNNIEVPANGYMSGILVRVDVASSGNSASVALHEDSPFSILSSVRLADINGGNLFGPMSGYDWAQAVKHGGYGYSNDPELVPYFAQSATGTGGTAGTMSFMMRIPVQVNPRDAYGALPNMNAAATFKLYFSIAALASAFATPPNGTVTVRVRCSLETWLVPQAVDAAGVPNNTTPPGLGSYQRWIKNVFTVPSGYFSARLPNVSNYIRTLVLIWRVSGARNTSNFPTEVDLKIDGYTRDQIARDEILFRMHERYGYDSTQLDTGVFTWDWTHELDGKPGFETRELWLPTNSATRLEVAGTFGAGGTLTVLQNDVVPAGGDHRMAG